MHTKLLLVLAAPLFFFTACTRSPAPGEATDAATPPTGSALVQSKGCVACHSSNGQPGVGPTFKGLFGRMEFFMDGSSQRVDEAYLRESIRTPTAKIVRPFQPTMPAVPLSDEELEVLVQYIKEQK